MKRTVVVPLLVLAVTLCAANGASSNATNQEIVGLKDIDKNEMGMETYFDIVKFFLGDIIQRKNISESFLNLSTIFVDGKLDDDSITDWKGWAEYLTGYAVCTCLGLLFVIAMPITGLIFCCCRLCGRCGSKGKDRESRRGACKRRTYCTLLLVLNTLMLGGAICGFVCTALLQDHMQSDGDKGTVGHIKSALDTFKGFVDKSVDEISTFVDTKFDTVSGTVLNRVNDSAHTAVDKVLAELNATSLLEEVRKVSNETLEIKKDLDNVTYLLGELTNETQTLEKNLTDIKANVKGVCNQAANDCGDLDVDTYNVNVDFTKLEDLRTEANKVAESLNMSKYIEDAEKSINAAKSKASESVQEQTQKANTSIANVKRQIDDGLSDLRIQKDDAMKDVQTFKENIEDSEDDIRKYSDYVYYAGIGMCSVLLLIVALYYVGVLFGLCGERPGEGAPCCNTGTGANFLMGGVAFTFLLTWVIMIVCVLLFATAGPAYTEVCRYFDGHEPSKFKIFDDALTKGLDIKDFYPNAPPDLSIVKTLSDCQENKAVFSALDLNYIVNLDNILSTKDLNKQIHDLKNSNFNIPEVTILNAQLEQELNDLGSAGLDSIKFDDYYAELSKTLITAPFGELATSLDKIAEGLSGDAKTTLEDSAARLRDLQNNAVNPINQKMVSLNITLKDLEQQQDISNLTNSLITHLTKAQTDFNSNSTRLVKQEIEHLAKNITTYTNNSVDDIKYKIRNEMLGCRDLSNSLYTVSDSVCVLVVRPINGFWFSLGWCLFMSIPCLIFAVLLASQYRREQEYMKDFEEPNYLMYGGPSPDTIPLTSRMRDDRRAGPSHHHHPGHPHQGYPVYPGGATNPGFTHDVMKMTPPPPYDDYHHYAPQQRDTHHDLAYDYPGGSTGDDRRRPIPAERGRKNVDGGRSQYIY